MTRFSAATPFDHAAPARTAVLLLQLGTPDAPTPAAVRRYLREFLSDPRVVEIPRLAWLPILHGIILRTRPAKSARKYASVWTDEGSPLAVWTARQAQALDAALGGAVLVRHAMRYGQPSAASQLDALVAAGAQRILVLPLYPQYAAATTASGNDAVMAWARRQRRQPEWRFVRSFHDDAGYIEALSWRVEEHWRTQGRGDVLLLSFHGIPARSSLLGDPYEAECKATARLLAARLGLADSQWRLSFQSRFGKAKWLQPYTEPTLVELAQAGVRRVDVMCPGFVADCLETLEEIAIEAKHTFLAAGGAEFRYVECLNDAAPWTAALAALTRRHLQGWPTQAARAAT